MKKHPVQCPHCLRQFEFTPPKKIKDQIVKHDVVYNECVKYWLKEFHPGWTFEGVQGKALQSILKKIKKAIIDSKKFVYSELMHIRWFIYFCSNMPDYYRDKDLQKINSAYNEIVTQIEKGKTNGSKQWHSKNSHDRFNEVNNRFKD